METNKEKFLYAMALLWAIGALYRGAILQDWLPGLFALGMALVHILLIISLNMSERDSHV